MTGDIMTGVQNDRDKMTGDKMTGDEVYGHRPPCNLYRLARLSAGQDITARRDGIAGEMRRNFFFAQRRRRRGELVNICLPAAGVCDGWSGTHGVDRSTVQEVGVISSLR
jgi:hypothetical protein